MTDHYYVSVRDGDRSGLLLGPFPTHEEALARVDRAGRMARGVDPDAHWYAYGTAKVTLPDDANPPSGRLNGLPVPNDRELLVGWLDRGGEDL